MTDLHDGQITDLLNNGMRHNPETIAVSYAILQEKQRLLALLARTRLMAMIDSADENALDYLAVELRAPVYKDTFPLDVKRRLIAGTLPFYARLGTPAAVESIIRTIFKGGSISEWFEYGGDPHHFSVDVVYTGEAITPETMGELRREINSIKRLSSWLDEIAVTFEIETSPVYVGGVLGRGITETKLPELQVDYMLNAGIAIAAAVISITQTTLSEIKTEQEGT